MSDNRLVWIVFALVFTLELGFGLFVSQRLGFIYWDALSRAANAFFVLFSRDPHLAAIGFVWNPLPSLLNLPFLLFSPWIPSLSAGGLSSIIVSSLFAGFTVAALIHAFGNKSEPRTSISLTAFLCVLLFALNPFIFWYGANGMSEAIFGFFLLFAVLRWTEWLRTRDHKPFIMASISLGFAFLCRYESIPFTAAMFAATLLALLQSKSPSRKSESSGIVLLLPSLFAVAIWIWLNYTIMGDPLYFMRSSYSNAGQSDILGESDTFSTLVHNPVLSMVYVLERAVYFLIPYIAIGVYRAINGSLWRIDFLSLTLLTLSIPVFQWIMITQGLSFGWLRFFYYPLLVAIAWLPYEFMRAQESPKKRMFHGLMVGAFALSIFAILPALGNPVLAPEEATALNYTDSPTWLRTKSNRQIAEILDESIFAKDTDSLVLADSFNAYEIILNSRYPARFINSTDRDFREFLNNPGSYRNLYFLVPQPGGLASLNAVNARYPEIYDELLPWASLTLELEGNWKLFKVTGNSN